MRVMWGALAALLVTPAMALAGGKITIGDNQWVTVGGGLRTSLNFEEDAAPSGEDWGKDFRVDSARIYLAGQIAHGIFAELNTELNSGDEDSARILDAVVKLEYSEGFRVWAGRFLPPSDRPNLDGPYYQPTWNYPFVSAFPAVFAGRDDGLAVWGQFKGGAFKYQVGAFQGADGGPNASDNPLFAGRLVANLRDPEPGYYNSSTYWGTKKIFAIAVTGQHQSDGAGTEAAPDDFTGLEVDVLFEQPTESGVLTAEGALYSFDAVAEATGFYVWAAWLFNSKTGPGQLQPLVRYQSWDVDGGDEVQQLDVQLNYVIAGDNARLHAVYTNLSGDASGSGFQLGAQLQF
jgi:hypothetical protein